MTTAILLLLALSPLKDGSPCSADRQCSEFSACAGGYCRATCSTENPCASGRKCLKVDGNLSICADTDIRPGPAPNLELTAETYVRVAAQTPAALTTAQLEGISDRAYGAACYTNGTAAMLSAVLSGAITFAITSDPRIAGAAVAPGLLVGFAYYIVGGTYHTSADRKLGTP